MSEHVPMSGTEITADGGGRRWTAAGKLRIVEILRGALDKPRSRKPTWLARSPRPDGFRQGPRRKPRAWPARTCSIG